MGQQGGDGEHEVLCRFTDRDLKEAAELSGKLGS
jgi:hypothetical protein